MNRKKHLYLAGIGLLLAISWVALFVTSTLVWMQVVDAIGFGVSMCTVMVNLWAATR